MMNRTAMSGAILLACATVAHAQSSVEIYGVQDLYLGRVGTRNGAVEADTTMLNAGGLTTSFVGFRGIEDLGGGLKAVFALEAYVRPDTGAVGRNDTDPFFGRASWVGLDSAYGRVLLGRMPTPYSLATTNFTPFPGTTTLGPMFANIFRNNVQGDTRSVNTIAYRSRRMAGFEADIQYSFGQEMPRGVNYKRDAATDGAVRYFNGPLSLVVSTRRINLNANNNGQKQVANMMGVMYDFGPVKLTGQYHHVKETLNNAALNATRKTYAMGASIPFGPGAFQAEYAASRFSDRIATSAARRQTYTVGYDYNLSRRTDVYLMRYSDTLKDPGSKQTITALGVRHRF